MTQRFAGAVRLLPTLVAIFVAVVLPTRAATIAWTNTLDGDWSVAANWKPNQVPGDGDTALITSNGTYTVTLDGGATIASLTLGAASGQQTLALSGNTLTLTNASTVNTNGILGLAGTLSGGGLLTVRGVLNWTGGLIDSPTRVLIATNAALNISGAAGKTIYGALTNAGMVTWTGGDLTLNNLNNPTLNGLIHNLAGGTFDVQNDQNINASFNTEFFNNAGLFRKSAGTGTNSIGILFNNIGIVDLQTGTIQFNGGGSGNGTFNTAAGATMRVHGGVLTCGPGSSITGTGTYLWTAGTVVINSMVTAQSVQWAGATLGGTNTFTSTLNWTSGLLDSGASLTIATNAVLNISGALDKTFYGALTNVGTVTWTGTGNLVVDNNNGAPFTGSINNLAGGIFDVQNDQSFGCGCFGAEFFNNAGMFRKSAGTGTTTIGMPFNNTGTVDAQSGTVNFAGTYDLTGGTLNFGISSLANFGQISFSTAATLTGTVSANLNGGYVPTNGNSFAVMTYPSQSGLFTDTNLPFADAWSVTYGATVLTLNVLNARPGIASQTNRTVDELTTLTVSNTATDPDIPPQTLTFSLASAPNGVTMNPTTGVLSWMPQQTNSPSTNTINVAVTDSGTPPLSATNAFQVIVREVNVKPSLPAIGTQTVNALAVLSVNNAATNFNIHSTNYGYGLLNPPSGATINSSGVISWTPMRSQGPSTNTITTVVTNGNPYDLINPRLTSTNSFTVIVYAPTQSQPSNYTVNAGQTVSFTASATDNDPSRTLTYSIISGPGSIGSSSGLFNWRATAASGGTSNNVQLRVSDNSVPPVTDDKSFYILVNPLAPVSLKPITKTSTNFQIQITGPIGPDYILQAVSAVTGANWTNRLTNTPAASPFTVTDTNVAGFSNRFYRVQLSP